MLLVYYAIAMKDAMHNHTQENTQHQFFIHGGDKRGTNRLLWVAIGLLPVFALAVWLLGDLGFWIGGGVYIVSLLGCFWWMGSGQAERYAITIDLATKTISATDRVQGTTLWEDDFRPEWLQIAEIQVVLSGETYRHPALVYAEEKVDLIMDTVPSSTRVLLGVGAKTEVEPVFTSLKA